MPRTRIAEIDAVRALRYGDSTAVDRWARLLVAEVISGRRVAEAVRHPLEFICMPLYRDDSRGLCLHLWEGDGKSVSPVVHAHSWDLWSYVLSGTVFNEHFTVEDETEYSCCRIYEVENVGAVDEICATDRLVSHSRRRLEEIPRGKIYRLAAGEFHCSGHDGLTATIVLGEHHAGMRDLALGLADRFPAAGRRESCGQEEVRALLRRLAP